jgi:hypothetical protein
MGAAFVPRMFRSGTGVSPVMLKHGQDAHATNFIQLLPGDHV